VSLTPKIVEGRVIDQRVPTQRPRSRRHPGPAPAPVHHQTYGFPGSETDLVARGLISAANLAPVKARLLLHLLIASRAGTTRIKQTFATAGAAS
jgi:hypothetical protein